MSTFERDRLKNLKVLKYTGPEYPKRSSPLRSLEAISYAKSVIVNAGEYDLAAKLRVIERKLEDKLGKRIKPEYRNLKK